MFPAGFTLFPSDSCIPVVNKTDRTNFLFPSGTIRFGIFTILHGDALCRADFHTCPTADAVFRGSVKRSCNEFLGSVAAESDCVCSNIPAAHVYAQSAENAFFIFQCETRNINSHFVCQFPDNLHIRRFGG